MKAMTLVGGNKTRIREESHLPPKPMIEIGTSIVRKKGGNDCTHVGQSV